MALWWHFCRRGAQYKSSGTAGLLQQTESHVAWSLPPCKSEVSSLSLFREDLQELNKKRASCGSADGSVTLNRSCVVATTYSRTNRRSPRPSMLSGGLPMICAAHVPNSERPAEISSRSNSCWDIPRLNYRAIPRVRAGDLRVSGSTVFPKSGSAFEQNAWSGSSHPERQQNTDKIDLNKAIYSLPTV